MIIRRMCTFVIFTVAIAILAAEAIADSDEEKRIADATTVLNEIIKIPEEGIPGALLKDAHGLAVLPNVVKVGFVVGGRHGKGVVTVRRKDGSWSRPIFLKMTAGSIGWQIGAQAADVILVFNSARSVEGILDGKFTLGADASVAAGPVGRSATAATDERLKAEIYSYSRARGLFAGLSFEGSKLYIDGDGNDAFYQSGDMTAKEVVSSKKLSTPQAALDFMKLIEKVSRGD